jgi:muramoyltetrapeptide carboxypeptidase
MEKPTLTIVAPAGKVDRVTFKKSLTFLKTLFDIQVGENVLNKNGYFAGTDEERLLDLQAAFDNDSLAVLMARGGYGTTRIIDQLHWKKFFERNKWLIGFSDITALHAYICNQGGISIHAPIATQASKEEYHEAFILIQYILQGQLPAYNFKSNAKNKLGESTGVLVGGTLSIIVDQIGTSSQLKTKDKILFIEEINESAYKIDRMLQQLKRCGALKGLKGLIVGHFTDITNEKEFGKTYAQIILDQVSEYNYPVAFGFPAGHEAPNLPIILGKKVKLVVDKNAVDFSYIES